MVAVCSSCAPHASQAPRSPCRSESRAVATCGRADDRILRNDFDHETRFRHGLTLKPGTLCLPSLDPTWDARGGPVSHLKGCVDWHARAGAVVRLMRQLGRAEGRREAGEALFLGGLSGVLEVTSIRLGRRVKQPALIYEGGPRAPVEGLNRTEMNFLLGCSSWATHLLLPPASVSPFALNLNSLLWSDPLVVGAFGLELHHRSQAAGVRPPRPP